MSGLDTLPPDQRAVLQLILKQGRGYTELAALLKIDAAAVRTRAHAGLDALGAANGGAPGGEQRARIADYLLGQQDDGERIVTLAELGDSSAVADWARALRTQLAPLASGPLPEVPEPAAPANGAAPAIAAAPRAAAGSATPPAPPASRRPASEASAPPAPPPSLPGVKPDPAAPRPSRLGGALLLGGVAVAVVVVAIVLIATSGGGGGGGGGSRPATSTPVRASRTTTTPNRAAQSTAEIVGQVNLAPTPAGGQALGVGLIERQGKQLVLALHAEKLPGNGTEDIYAAWLQGTPGTKFLGFVPEQVKAGGTFTVSASLPANARAYATVLVTRESITTTPHQPGPTILSGPPVWRG